MGGLTNLSYYLSNLTDGSYSIYIIAYNQYGDTLSNYISIEVCGGGDVGGDDDVSDEGVPEIDVSWCWWLLLVLILTIIEVYYYRKRIRRRWVRFS
jgi:hypothetical protein